MSEWLGTGLQNRLHQFESGWNLKKSRLRAGFFYFLLRAKNRRGSPETSAPWLTSCPAKLQDDGVICSGSRFPLLFSWLWLRRPDLMGQLRISTVVESLPASRDVCGRDGREMICFLRR